MFDIARSVSVCFALTVCFDRPLDVVVGVFRVSCHLHYLLDARLGLDIYRAGVAV